MPVVLVSVIQFAIVAAVQEHPPPASTWKLPAPPEAGADADVEVRVTAHGTPAWITE